MIRSALVVGAGLAGLVAAQRLAAAGIRVTVFDKGRGPGGRMATRREGDACWDHGAQFFTARDPRFAEMVARWTRKASPPAGIVPPGQPSSTGCRVRAACRP